MKEQSPRMCKKSNSKMNSDSDIGKYLIKIAECARTYSDYNLLIMGTAEPYFHLSVLESVYIRTQNRVLCKQTEFSVHRQSMHNRYANA